MLNGSLKATSPLRNHIHYTTDFEMTPRFYWCILIKYNTISIVFPAEKVANLPDPKDTIFQGLLKTENNLGLVIKVKARCYYVLACCQGLSQLMIRVDQNFSTRLQGEVDPENIFFYTPLRKPPPPKRALNRQEWYRQA